MRDMHECRAHLGLNSLQFNLHLSTQFLVMTSWGEEWMVFEQNRSADILRPGDEVVIHWAPEHTFGLDVPPEA